MEGTIFSLLPPLIAIVMAIITRRVLLSLGVGIVLSAILIANFNPGESFTVLFTAVKSIFIEDGDLNTWNVFIIFFLLILGIITAFISITGGSRAFGDWAIKRVKTKTGAQLVAAVMGVLIFIDDYFNALTVGQVSRPITDRHRVSRAKLAYIIDSTSAPVCVVSPISSWGAFIISIIAAVFATHSFTEVSAFSAFIQMIPMNLYVWTTLLLVFLTAFRDVNLGQMKVHEERARTSGELFDPEKEIPGEIKEELPSSKQGTVGDLIWPIVTLIVAVIGFMVLIGYRELDVVEMSLLMEIFEATDASAALFYGGLVGLVVVFISFFRQVKKGAVEGGLFGRAIGAGAQSMLPAIYILIFAWAIGELIGQLGTGSYLASVVEQANLNLAFLPAILFIIAGIMGFSTGTSWGSFGILIPIAGDIAAATDISLILPSMAAVLAGAVFGDHCSPISDTTILSSTGAGSNHIDHVLTQLPYAITAALITIVGYLVLGFTGSTLLGLVVALGLIVVLSLFFKKSDQGVTEGNSIA